MLLSRLAENAFWLGRYLERAEDLARALRAYDNICLDLPGQAAPGWHRLAALAGVEPATTASLEPRGDGHGFVQSFVDSVILDRRNPSSLLGALHAARENLRRARSLLPSDCWHCLNPLYLQIARLGTTVGPVELGAVLQHVLAVTRELAGHVNAGMLRDEGYAFLRVGVLLERTDMTLRIAHVVAESLMPLDQSGAFEDVKWMGLLKAVGAYGTYRHRYHARMDFARALELLIFERRFPRSFAHGLQELGRHLGELPRSTAPLAALEACRPVGVVGSRAALGKLVDDVLPHLARLSATLHRTYFAGEPAAVRAASPAQEILV